MRLVKHINQAGLEKNRGLTKPPKINLNKYEKKLKGKYTIILYYICRTNEKSCLF